MKKYFLLRVIGMLFLAFCMQGLQAQSSNTSTQKSVHITSNSSGNLNTTGNVAPETGTSNNTGTTTTTTLTNTSNTTSSAALKPKKKEKKKEE